jgi:hypothetical protein
MATMRHGWRWETETSQSRTRFIAEPCAYPQYEEAAIVLQG